MVSVIPNANPSVTELKYFREISTKSISEILRASETKTSIRDFKILGTEWNEEKKVLAKIMNRFITDESVPFQLIEDNELMTQEFAQNRLRFWRGIELETEMDVELELGEISHSHEFKPSSEDWT